MSIIIEKLRDSSRELGSVKVLAVCAMLLALRIVLGIFSNFTLAVVPFVKIGFSFIPVAVAAYLYGPVCTAVISGAGDVLSIIFANPTAFSLNPAITACCVWEGMIYGFALYHGELSLKRVIIAKAAVLALCHLPLNTLALSFLMGMPYLTLLLYRAAVLIPFAAVEVAIIMIMKKPLERIERTL